jgi:hypothetical protein
MLRWWCYSDCAGSPGPGSPLPRRSHCPARHCSFARCPRWTSRHTPRPNCRSAPSRSFFQRSSYPRSPRAHCSRCRRRPGKSSPAPAPRLRPLRRRRRAPDRGPHSRRTSGRRSRHRDSRPVRHNRCPPCRRRTTRPAGASPHSLNTSSCCHCSVARSPHTPASHNRGPRSPWRRRSRCPSCPRRPTPSRTAGGRCRSPPCT